MLGVPRDTNTYILFHEILFYNIRNHHYKVINPPKYRLRAIIRRDDKNKLQHIL